MIYAYAVCLLARSNAELNERNITSVLEAANVSVERSRVKAIVAALEGVDIAASADRQSGTAKPRQTTVEPGDRAPSAAINTIDPDASGGS